MEKIKSFFKKYVFPASFMFTLFTLLVLSLSTGNSAENGEANSATLRILLIAFAYFIYVMITSGVYKTGLSPFFRALIHYLLTGIPLALFLVYISNRQASNEGSFSSSTIVILMVVYTVIYAATAAVVLAVSKKNQKKNEGNYKSQFGKI